MQVGLIFLFGTLMGSFLNVCIYRLPRKESVVWPGSRCPDCKAPIPLWLNIPILSYLVLGGKCRNCKQPVPIIYPLVEVVTGVLLVLLWRYYGLSLTFVHYAILVLFLLPISLIDLHHKLIFECADVPRHGAGDVFVDFF